MPSRRTGFTLIELLVVIAIIAIIAAILFPVFISAKEKGREASCKSNMKQLASAFQQYLDDWHGSYPDQTTAGIPYQSGYSNPLGASWIVQFSHRRKSDQGNKPAGLAKPLWPYIKNLKVFKCPSEWKDALKLKNQGAIWLPYEAGSSYYFKHALNFYANYYMRPIKQSEVSYPTRTSLLYEEAWHILKDNPLLWNQPNMGPTKRVNCIFIDCHVGYIDIPYNPISGYDGNWYYYDFEHDVKNPTHTWDVSRGARDKW